MQRGRGRRTDVEMTMINIMLFVTLHTIMSDQLKLFHNQPFSEAGIPPSTPEIIKLNIKRENPVAPGSLTYQEMDVSASVRKEEKVIQTQQHG